MPGKTRYLVAYDITDDKKRNRVANILKNYGVRIQKSVFECNVRPGTVLEIRRHLMAEIDEKTDSVLIVPICKACAGQKMTLGLTVCFEEEEFRVI